MKYTVLIVEDMVHAQNRLKRFIAAKPKLELKQVVGTNKELVEALQNNEFDLMLLDIHLHEQSSLDVIEKINNLPYIIFITADVNFAHKAFTLGAIDYLLKPFEEKRFDEAINKFLIFRKNCIPYDMHRAIKKIEGDTKYKTSPLTEKEIDEIAKKIIEYIESTKAYTDHQISLKSFSKDLGISTSYISQVINQKLEKNFFDFINQYRLDEAKRMMADPKCDDMTIAEIFHAAGSNSKSEFNTIFEEYENTTPQEFRKKLRGK